MVLLRLHAIAAALFFLGNVAIGAEETPFHGERVRDVIAQLNLTDEQRAKAMPIIVEGFKERAQILKDAGIKRGERPTRRQIRSVKDPIQASRERTETQLSQILSPEQMTGYNQMMDKLRSEFRNR